MRGRSAAPTCARFDVFERFQSAAAWGDSGSEGAAVHGRQLAAQPFWQLWKASPLVTRLGAALRYRNAETLGGRKRLLVGRIDASANNLLMLVNRGAPPPDFYLGS